MKTYSWWCNVSTRCCKLRRANSSSNSCRNSCCSYRTYNNKKWDRYWENCIISIEFMLTFQYQVCRSLPHSKYDIHTFRKIFAISWDAFKLEKHVWLAHVIICRFLFYKNNLLLIWGTRWKQFQGWDEKK